MSWESAWKVLEPLTTWTEAYRDKTRICYELARDTRDGCIMELGTQWGVGAVALWLGACDGHGARVFTIDDYTRKVCGSDDTKEVYGPQDIQQCINVLEGTKADVTFIRGDAHQLPVGWNKPIGLLIRDIHGQNTFVDDFHTWTGQIVPNGKLVFRCPVNRDIKETVAAHNWELRYVDANCSTNIAQKTPQRAAFWIASQTHFEEAARSAASLCRCMPSIKKWLFTPDLKGWFPEVFDEIRPLPTQDHPMWYGNFINYVRLAIQHLSAAHLMMVDTDIHFIDEVGEVFELLDRFDIAGVHAVARKTGSVKQRVPDSFPEFNTGLFAMRNNARVHKLWADTQKRYGTGEGYGNTDQAPLRETMWYDFDGKMYVLPPEYHCRYQHGTFVHDKVRVLHGRVGDIKAIAASINRNLGCRTWNLGSS